MPKPKKARRKPFRLLRSRRPGPLPGSLPKKLRHKFKTAKGIIFPRKKSKRKRKAQPKVTEALDEIIRKSRPGDLAAGLKEELADSDSEMHQIQRILKWSRDRRRNNKRNDK